MFKRIVLISIALAALAFLIGGYFYLQKGFVAGTDPFEAVTGDAALIVRTKNLAGFLPEIKSGSDFWTELETVLNSRKLISGALFLDSLLANNRSAYELVAEKSLCFSIHTSGRDKYDAVFYLSLSLAREKKIYNDLMQDLLSGKALVSERIYNRSRIYDASFHRDRETGDLAWTVSDGLFILSFSSLLIENALDQLDRGENIHDDQAFQKVLATSGRDVDANISVNLRHFPRYISSFTEGESKNLLSGFSDLANWAEMDLHMRDDALLLNGFSFTAVEENNYLDLFMGQSPRSITVETVIPGNSSAFVAVGLSDIDDFYNSYLYRLESGNRLARHKKMKEDFIRLTGSDPAEAFHSFMEGEAAVVMNNWEEPGEKGESFLLMKTVSRSLAAETLQGMLKHHAGITGSSEESYREVYRVDSETSFDIYRFPFPDTGEILFGRVFGMTGTAYYTFVGNYLVFGESVDGLSGFIHANVLNQTMSADSRFREFSEFRVSKGNFFFYSNVARSAGLLTTFFRKELSDNLTEHIESFRKFQVLSMQFSTGRDMIYNNIYLKYSPRIIEEPGTEWQTLLDTVTDFKPLLMVNHNTGESEIFVQDAGNNIYLINRAGRILWKRPLPGKIMGNVYQIDYYDNNRLQMLFNTREQIFLVDRNGNDVERYPVRLPSPATNGISLFDYDNDKNYRIFVACEDKSVEVRSKEGNIVTGWNFAGSEHNIEQEIKHYRAGGRDYIVMADRQRVYILDRRGNIRVRPDKVFPVSARNGIAFEGRTPESDPRLVLTDTLGRVWHIGFDGTTGVTETGDYSSDHFFDFRDVNADGYREYIFIDNNRMDVYRRDGLPVFSHEFPVAIDHPPAYYYFSATDRRLGAVSGSSEQIFLLDSGGDICNGFPLTGRSGFTIGFMQPQQEHYSLIVGAGDNFLYNYAVY